MKATAHDTDSESAEDTPPAPSQVDAAAGDQDGGVGAKEEVVT